MQATLTPVPNPTPPRPSASTALSREPVRVEIEGVRIPFGDLIVLMLKFCLASVPVAIVVGVIYLLIAGIMAAMITAP